MRPLDNLPDIKPIPTAEYDGWTLWRRAPKNKKQKNKNRSVKQKFFDLLKKIEEAEKKILFWFHGE